MRKNYIIPATELQSLALTGLILTSAGMIIKGGDTQTGARVPGRVIYV